jgi:hypothetical protein
VDSPPRQPQLGDADYDAAAFRRDLSGGRLRWLATVLAALSAVLAAAVFTGLLPPGSGPANPWAGQSPRRLTTPPHPMADTPPHARLALAFARALAAGDFQAAHKMLSPALRADFPPERLRQEYEGMFEYAGDTKAAAVELGSTMEDWPDKAGAEVGWAYVSIVGPNPVHGGDWVEAVAVTVEQTDGRLLIRDVQWGRP